VKPAIQISSQSPPLRDGASDQNNFRQHLRSLKGSPIKARRKIFWGRAKAMFVQSKFSLFALGFLAFSPVSRTALAATSTASIAVTVTVQSSCQVSAAMRPGTYITAVANPTSSVSVTCDRPTAYNVELSAGVAPDPPATIRTTSAGSALPVDAMPPERAYIIYRSLAAGTNTGSGISSAQLRSVDGQIAQPEQPAPATDADTVFITITY
jgi:spore coat protein U-like protein